MPFLSSLNRTYTFQNPFQLAVTRAAEKPAQAGAASQEEGLFLPNLNPCANKYTGRNLIHIQSWSLASSTLMHRDHSPELKKNPKSKILCLLVDFLPRTLIWNIISCLCLGESGCLISICSFWHRDTGFPYLAVSFRPALHWLG